MHRSLKLRWVQFNLHVQYIQYGPLDFNPGTYYQSCCYRQHDWKCTHFRCFVSYVDGASYKPGSAFWLLSSFSLQRMGLRLNGAAAFLLSDHISVSWVSFSFRLWVLWNQYLFYIKKKDVIFQSRRPVFYWSSSHPNISSLSWWTSSSPYLKMSNALAFSIPMRGFGESEAKCTLEMQSISFNIAFQRWTLISCE